MSLSPSLTGTRITTVKFSALISFVTYEKEKIEKAGRYHTMYTSIEVKSFRFFNI